MRARTATPRTTPDPKHTQTCGCTPPCRSPRRTQPSRTRVMRCRRAGCQVRARLVSAGACGWRLRTSLLGRAETPPLGTRAPTQRGASGALGLHEHHGCLGHDVPQACARWVVVWYTPRGRPAQGAPSLQLEAAPPLREAQGRPPSRTVTWALLSRPLTTTHFAQTRGTLCSGQPRCSCNPSAPEAPLWVGALAPERAFQPAKTGSRWVAARTPQVSSSALAFDG